MYFSPLCGNVCNAPSIFHSKSLNTETNTKQMLNKNHHFIRFDDLQALSVTRFNKKIEKEDFQQYLNWVLKAGLYYKL